MRRRSRTRRVLKWVGLVGCVLIAFAFVYSTRRAVKWTSPRLSEASLMLGSVYCGWIRDDAPLEDWKYPPRPGWGHASYLGSVKLDWWIVCGSNKYWRWVSVPLWMPFLLLGAPTTVLWYRDRKGTAEGLRRLSIWLTPQQPKRLTLRWVVLFCALHVAALFSCLILFNCAYHFFVDYRANDPIDAIAKILLPALFWSTPLWALLWAWLWTRLLNWLFRRQPGWRCAACGYNLTGNVSGVCPECGDAI